MILLFLPCFHTALPRRAELLDRSCRFRTMPLNRITSHRFFFFFFFLQFVVLTMLTSLDPNATNRYVNLDQTVPDVHSFASFGSTVPSTPLSLPHAVVEDDGYVVSLRVVTLANPMQGLTVGLPSANTLGVSLTTERTGSVTMIRPRASGGGGGGGVTTTPPPSPLVNWTTVLRSIQLIPSLSVGTSWAFSGSRRVVFTAFDSSGRESLPATLLVCGGLLDCPPWVDLNGDSPGVDVGDIVATEDGPPAPLGLGDVFVWQGAGRSITGAQLQVTIQPDPPTPNTHTRARARARTHTHTHTHRPPSTLPPYLCFYSIPQQGVTHNC
jgi:hypothetical protein